VGLIHFRTGCARGGRLGGDWRYPLKPRWSRASFLVGGVRLRGCHSRYLFLLVSIRSRSSLSLRVAIRRCLTSCGPRGLFWVSSLSSNSLLQRRFQRRNAHSDAAMRSRRVAPGLEEPSGELCLRRGAMIVVFHGAKVSYYVPCLVAAVGFTVKDNVLHWVGIRSCCSSDISLVFRRLLF